MYKKGRFVSLTGEEGVREREGGDPKGGRHYGETIGS